MRTRILRFFLYTAYACALLVLFAFAAYIAFSLFVRSGATRTPEVVGKSLEEAAAELADHGLILDGDEVEKRYSETVVAGHIVEQRPRAGSLVKRGNRMTLVVSLGPQRLVVPDLAGQALPAAQVALTAAGLSLGRTVRVWSPHTMAGMVVEQSPPAGTLAARLTPIDVMLSLGASQETYVMPDLVYRGYETVRRFFEQRGLRIGSVRFEPYEGIPEGVILRQFPLAGHPLGRLDAISLVVAAGDEREEEFDADRTFNPGR